MRRSTTILTSISSALLRPLRASAHLHRRARRRAPGGGPSPDFRRPGRRISGCRRCAIRRRPAGPRRRARADHVRDCARPRRVGNRDRRQSEGVGQGSDRPDKFAGKISAADKPAWLRDRAWTARDLGQINDVFRRCVRLQVSVDDEFEQAHPVRLGGSMTSCCWCGDAICNFCARWFGPGRKLCLCPAK